jgi:NADH-quinone oxidoreductase subunit G
MAKVTINGRELQVPDGTNVVKAAELANIEIPHYCYHPGLSVAGNCRMCLVDIRALSSKQTAPLPKLQIGCNTAVQDGMVVETDNEKVRQARKSVLEFLLINHPIDCPICDQAGECKLQEYYMDYGRYSSRFSIGDKVDKRKVLPIGPDVMLDQERCILCTRCVRFLDEVTETHDLTITERGDHCELTLAAGAWVDNPYAANIVDICPVGALTSRDFRFKARVWYLEATPSMCTGCATGCNIDVYSRRDEIYRLKPRLNPEVNGYWMCDFGRTTFLENRHPDRARSSLLREDGRFVEAPAEHVAGRAASALEQAKRVGVAVSAAVNLEEGFLLSEISARLGGGPRIVVSPRVSAIPDDGFLISTDRFPNRRGLLALGFVDAEAFSEACDGVLVARADVAGVRAGTDLPAAWRTALEAAVAVVVLNDRVSETTTYADHFVAIASHFEGEGSFVNASGKLQLARAAVAPPGEAVEGWRALAVLLAALGGTRYASHREVVEGILERLKTTDPAITAAAPS